MMINALSKAGSDTLELAASNTAEKASEAGKNPTR
jgi:hypothetical protein